MSWIVALARKQNRLVSEITRALDTDPDALIDEIAAVRLELAQQTAREVLAKEPKNAKELKQLRTSDNEDDRLAYALYERARREKRT